LRQGKNCRLTKYESGEILTLLSTKETPMNTTPHESKEVPRASQHDILREQAVTLTKTVANLDEEIKKLTDTRAGVQKELRSVKSKLVTIELNKAAAA
jgi:chromosome segregation ATPase